MMMNSVSFMHMFSACLNCVESFKSLHGIQVKDVAETRTVLQSVTYGRMDTRTFARTRVKLYVFPHFVAGHKKKLHLEQICSI